MLTGENPFATAVDLNELFVRIKSTNFALPDKLSAEAKDFIKKLLVDNPSERLGAKSIDDIKDHPFFAKTNWTEVLHNRHKGPLTPRFDKEECLLKALNIKLPNREGARNVQLKGFTFNENFQDH